MAKVSLWENEDPIVTNPDRDAEVAFNRRVLEKLRFSTSALVDDQILAQSEYLVDFAKMRYRLTRDVLADHLVKDEYSEATTHEWPATTWQMFKHTHENSWWMRWLVKRRPVIMLLQSRRVYIEVDRYLMYPEATIVSDKLGKPVIYEKIRKL